MKVIKWLFRWIFILCFPIFLLTASLAIAFNSQWIFNYGFEKYDVSKSTGLSEQNLSIIAKSWTSYINSGNEYWDITIEQDGSSFVLFSIDEQKHFQDVKQLIVLDYIVLSLSIVLCIGYIYYRLRSRTLSNKNRLANDIIIGSMFSIVSILVLGAASLINFDALFLKMHYLVFTNEFWYAEGYMLELFPGGFWYDAAFISIGLMTILILISLITGIFMLRLKNWKITNHTDVKY